MKINWRKILWWTVVIFALYAVYKSPEQAASAVRSVGDWISTAISSIFNFFDRILQS